MRIAIGADHNGLGLKTLLIERLTAQGHTVEDRGTHDTVPVDYPRICSDLGARVLEGHVERAIVIGGSGSGEQIACNKIRGIRAGLCHDLFTARIARAHNDTNLLVLGAKVVPGSLAGEIADVWLGTAFLGGRHQERLDQVSALERGEQLDPLPGRPGASRPAEGTSG